MNTKELAKKMRAHIVQMVHDANASHVGSCLSAVDLLAVLYGSIMNIDPKNPEWVDRDRFIMSKGHAAAAVYSVLAERGFFPVDWLKTFGQDDSKLIGHVTSFGVPGVELSTGSLGHGLSVGCGIALGLKANKSPGRSFVLLSDGEIDEGSIWEAILFAPHHQLDNLTVLLDYNKIQSFGTVKEVLDLEPMKDKWLAANWEVREVDGHDHEAIEKTLKGLPFSNEKPSVLIAHTTKGKGVSYMENELKWHYKSPNEDELKQAFKEIEEQG